MNQTGFFHQNQAANPFEFQPFQRINFVPTKTENVFRDHSAFQTPSTCVDDSDDDQQFLRKKSSNRLETYPTDQSEKENSLLLQSAPKKSHSGQRQKKPLKQIKVNDHSKTQINDSQYDITQILINSINEKKQNDKIEREKKKHNKILMIKMQQRYKQIFPSNEMVMLEF